MATTRKHLDEMSAKAYLKSIRTLLKSHGLEDFKLDSIRLSKECKCDRKTEIKCWREGPKGVFTCYCIPKGQKC